MHDDLDPILMLCALMFVIGWTLLCLALATYIIPDSIPRLITLYSTTAT